MEKRPKKKAFVVNALGRGFDLEEIDIAAPMGREVLVEVKAARLCHTDMTLLLEVKNLASETVMPESTADRLFQDYARLDLQFT